MVFGQKEKIENDEKSCDFCLSFSSLQILHGDMVDLPNYYR